MVKTEHTRARARTPGFPVMQQAGQHEQLKSQDTAQHSYNGR